MICLFFLYAASHTVHNTQLDFIYTARRRFSHKGQSTLVSTIFSVFGKSTLVHVILLPKLLLEPVQILDFCRYFLGSVNNTFLEINWIKNTRSPLLVDGVLVDWRCDEVFGWLDVWWGVWLVFWLVGGVMRYLVGVLVGVWLVGGVMRCLVGDLVGWRCDEVFGWCFGWTDRLSCRAAVRRSSRQSQTQPELSWRKNRERERHVWSEWCKPKK